MGSRGAETSTWRGTRVTHTLTHTGSAQHFSPFPSSIEGVMLDGPYLPRVDCVHSCPRLQQHLHHLHVRHTKPHHIHHITCTSAHFYILHIMSHARQKGRLVPSLSPIASRLPGVLSYASTVSCQSLMLASLSYEPNWMLYVLPVVGRVLRPP